MKDLMKLCPKRMGRERIEREYDLRIRNCVSEGEYESRMVVWDSLNQLSATNHEVSSFVELAYENMQRAQKNVGEALSVSYQDFVNTAKDEVNYIKIHVADTKAQAIWYVLLFAMICGIVALYI